MNISIGLKVFPCSYTKSINVIFDNNSFIDKYEVYRNDNLLATLLTEELKDNHQGEHEFFRKPCLFEQNSHHTKLFKKSTEHEILYEDKDIKPHTEYSYRVKYYRQDEYIGETEEKSIKLE